MRKLIILAILPLITIVGFAQTKIDRYALVHRHNIINHHFDSLPSLSIGNGRFAFTVDITGLQSFPDAYAKGVPLGTESEWGRHSFINTNNYTFDENLKDYFLHGKIKSLPKNERLKKAALLAPVLRGFCSSKTKIIGHFTDDERVLEFINSNDLEKLAPMGTSCPGHFLRTKISPLVLNFAVNEEINNFSVFKEKDRTAIRGI